MVQISADTPAQIQSDAAGFFVRSAVASGKALFKNAWQIFCGNADAGVPDAERFRRFQENGDRAAGGCVFQRIGQHLFQYKQQPFFVCQHLAVQRLVFQTNLPVDELGVKALDDFTLEITLENPADYFVSMTSMSAFMPVREDLVEKYGNEFGGSADKQVYNGPFVVSEYSNGKVELTKNPDYYDNEKISLDGVEILTVADQTTAVSMFDAGELDLAEVPTELAAQYEGKTQSYYNGADDYAALNHRNKYLANKNLRLAMNYAVNREEYILLTHNGLYQANQRYVLPQVRGVDGEYGTEYPLEAFPLQGDMDKAKENSS